MLIASCEDGGAYVWSLTTWSKVIPPLVHERAVRRAEFSPDGRYILTAGWDNVLQLWNGKTGARAGPILRHSSPIMGASISFDGRRIMTSCTDGTLRIWDLAGQTIPEWLTADPLSPQAHYSVRTNGNCLEMYSLGRNASPLGSLKTDQPIKRFFLSDQSPHIVTASLAADQSGETNYSVGVWDGATGKRCSPLVAVKEVPSCVALDAADQSLVLSSGNSVRIAALASGLWRCPTLELDEKVRGLAFDPRGRRLAVWTEFNVHLIDALNGKALVSPLRHERSVSKVLFSRAEDWILTCTADGAIRPCYAQVWNTRTGAPVGRRLWHEDGVKGAAWVTDGQTAVTVGEDGLGRIWDVRQSRQVASELKHRHEISDVVVSDDASLIATASWDKTFRLWDAATALPVSPRISLPYELQRVRFTPASGGLVAEEFDGGAWRFPTTPARWSNAVLDGLAALLNGKALGRNTEDQFHAAAALELQWRKMKTELPELFQVTPAEIVAWHRLQARYCFLAGDQSGERLHVNFLLQQDPNDAYGLRRLARLNEIQGRLAR
jgi:WD40 repeat protein